MSYTKRFLENNYSNDYGRIKCNVKTDDSDYQTFSYDTYECFNDNRFSSKNIITNDRQNEYDAMMEDYSFGF